MLHFGEARVTGLKGGVSEMNYQAKATALFLLLA
jgi:hypothetical protein